MGAIECDILNAARPGPSNVALVGKSDKGHFCAWNRFFGDKQEFDQQSQRPEGARLIKSRLLSQFCNTRNVNRPGTPNSPVPATSASWVHVRLHRDLSGPTSLKMQ